MVLSSEFGKIELHRWSGHSIQHQQGRQLRTSTKRGLEQSAVWKSADRARNNPQIPDPELFNFGSQETETAKKGLPIVAECAAHLELLQAFCCLRRRILCSTALDKALGIVPEPRTVYRKEYRYRRRNFRKAVQLKDNTFQERRKTKWPFFVSVAAARFLHWAKIVEDYKQSALSSQNELLHLPPLDVLMVWHALLLNTSWFQSFEDSNMKCLAKITFPWKRIHEAIDSDDKDWPYKLTEGASSWISQKTSLWPDLFEGLTGCSSSVKEILANYGKVKSNGKRGIHPSSIDTTIYDSGGCRPHNQNRQFLNCLQVSQSNNGTITGLVDAVTRQESFAGKMERQLWIRSPGLEGMLQRSIDRYSKFLALFKMYRNTVLVPTLDVDLVWHTHQCSPALYKSCSSKMTGRMIHHDDKLGKGTLDPGFDRTRDLYRIRFAKEYNLCHCWDCALLLNLVEQGNIKDETAIARRVQEEVGYYRAVEIARRIGQKLLPVRSLS